MEHIKVCLSSETVTGLSILFFLLGATFGWMVGHSSGGGHDEDGVNLIIIDKGSKDD